VNLPTHYRQLTRDQILARWPGQQRPLCHVELIRLYDPRPQTMFIGEATLYLQWSDYAAGGRRARRLKQHEPRTLAIISVSNPVAWAEYSPAHHLNSDGSLTTEDYLMWLYAEDGRGRTRAEEDAYWQAQAEALMVAVVTNFADLGAQAVTLGAVTLLTPPTLMGYVTQAERIAAAAMEAHTAAGTDTVRWAPHCDEARHQLAAISAQLHAAAEMAATTDAQLDAYQALTQVQNLQLGLPILAGDRY
jgi:hypothetical protein